MLIWFVHDDPKPQRKRGRPKGSKTRQSSIVADVVADLAQAAQAEPARKGKPGQKPKTFTEQQREDVAVLAELGTPHETIARVLGIHVQTLREHFSEELADGKEFCRAKVKLKIFKLCMEEDRAMLMFFAKTQMNWRETSNVDHTHTVTLESLISQVVQYRREADAGSSPLIESPLINITPAGSAD